MKIIKIETEGHVEDHFRQTVTFEGSAREYGEWIAAIENAAKKDDLTSEEEGRLTEIVFLVRAMEAAAVAAGDD